MSPELANLFSAVSIQPLRRESCLSASCLPYRHSPSSSGRSQLFKRLLLAPQPPPDRANLSAMSDGMTLTTSITPTMPITACRPLTSWLDGTPSCFSLPPKRSKISTSMDTLPTARAGPTKAEAPYREYTFVTEQQLLHEYYATGEEGWANYTVMSCERENLSTHEIAATRCNFKNMLSRIEFKDCIPTSTCAYQNPWGTRNHTATSVTKAYFSNAAHTWLDFTKAKPGCWTRWQAFAQVRHGSNIQLLPYSLVSTGSVAPRRAELGRAARFSSLVAAPGHGGLIRDRRLSAMLSRFFAGRADP